MADLEQHLRGELLQVKTPVSRLSFGLSMYIRYIRYLTFPSRPLTIKRPLIPNVLHSSAGNDGRTVVTCGPHSFVFRVCFLNEDLFGFITAKIFHSWLEGKRTTFLLVKVRTFSELSLSLSLRSVCGEKGFLSPHFWPPRQHQHSPECQIPAGW